MADLYRIVYTGCMLLVGASEAAFFYFMYGTKSTQNHMNRLAAVTVVSVVGLIVPEFFAVGRTDAECSAIQHFEAACAGVAIWLVLNFYLIRSNQVAPETPFQQRLGTGAIVVLFALFVYNQVLLHREMVPVVVDGACIALLNDVATGLFGFVLPVLMEFAISARFTWFIFKSMAATRTLTNTSPMMRLLIVTCAVQLTTLIGDTIVFLALIDVIEVADPRRLGMLIAIQCTYKACSVTWPVIIINVLKKTARFAEWRNKTTTQRLPTKTVQLDPGRHVSMSDISAAI